MPVTNLKILDNQTDWPVDVINHEKASDNKSLPPKYKLYNNALWIPWCDNDADLANGKYAEVVVHSQPTAGWLLIQHAGFIWQLDPARNFSRKDSLISEGGELELTVWNNQSLFRLQKLG